MRTIADNLNGAEVISRQTSARSPELDITPFQVLNGACDSIFAGLKMEEGQEFVRREYLGTRWYPAVVEQRPAPAGALVVLACRDVAPKRLLIARID